MDTETVPTNRSAEFGLEPENFRIDSEGWPERRTPNGVMVKIGLGGKVFEILDGRHVGEQLFTLEAALEETVKAGKLIPTRKQWNEIICGIRGAFDPEGSWQDDASVRSALALPLAGYREPTSGAVYYLGFRCFLWSSNRDASARYFGRRISVTADQIHPVERCLRDAGYSVRCLAGRAFHS